MGLTDDEDVPSGIRWFGESWDAPICDPERHIPTPVGWTCHHCLSPIEEYQRGVLMGLLFEVGGWSEVHTHLACFLADMGIAEIDLAHR